MANVVTDSAVITQLDSTDGTTNVSTQDIGGKVRACSGTVAFPVQGDDDIVALTRLPGLAKLTSIRIACDALGGNDYNIGLYDYNATKTIATVKNESVYADAVNLSSATAVTEYLFSARNINLIENLVAEDAGDTVGTDDEPFYDLCITRGGSSGTEVVGDMTWIVEYVID